MLMPVLVGMTLTFSACSNSSGDDSQTGNDSNSSATSSEAQNDSTDGSAKKSSATITAENAVMDCDVLWEIGAQFVGNLAPRGDFDGPPTENGSTLIQVCSWGNGSYGADADSRSISFSTLTGDRATVACATWKSLAEAAGKAYVDLPKTGGCYLVDPSTYTVEYAGYSDLGVVKLNTSELAGLSEEEITEIFEKIYQKAESN